MKLVEKKFPVCARDCRFVKTRRLQGVHRLTCLRRILEVVGDLCLLNGIVELIIDSAQQVSHLSATKNQVIEQETLDRAASESFNWLWLELLIRLVV